MAETKELYRVRKDWKDSKSQLGAYSILANAKKTCDKAGEGYYVYNSAGEVVYPEPKIQEEPKLDTSYVNTSAADPKVMWDFFKSKGLSDFGVACLMGNLYAESALRSCNLQNTYEKSLGMTDAEYTAAVDSGVYTNFIKDKAGYGLAQWTYWSLKEQMYNYFQERKKSIGDLDTQMEFLAYQLSTSYKAVWNGLVNATSVREASDIMLLKFERPADQSEAVQVKRANYGQKYYDAYATKEEVKVEEVKPTMKYSEKNPPLVCMQTQSTCYKGTRVMEVKGVLWHSTGANNPTLKRYVQPSDVKPAADTYDKEQWLKILGTNKYKNDWNHISREAGLNCWIGKLDDGTVTTVQTMPWNYRPWGCGSGSKGSCNNGWIQFEICEDGLEDAEYFAAVYKEACEITAYLCDMFNIDPHGTVAYNGQNIPTVLCHADSYKLGVGGNHGDVLHWFPKHGKSMDDVRNDVAALLPVKEEIKEEISKIEPIVKFHKGDIVSINKGATYYSGKSIPSWVAEQNWVVVECVNDRVVIDKSEDGKHSINSPVHANHLTIVKCVEAPVYYRVRKSWDDEKSQIGAYTSLENAQKACDLAGVEYFVFDENGKAIYTPENLEGETLKVGDAVKLIPDATYYTGVKIPNWVIASKLYIREIRKNGDYVISTQKTGAVTGVVHPEMVVPYTDAAVGFKTYTVIITADALNVRAGAGTQYKINTVVHKNDLYTIVDEKNGWGKLKSGAGWISLSYTKKVQ